MHTPHLTVAFQGIDGSFSSIASRHLFQAPFRAINTVRFRDIFEAVVDAQADFGVIPIENALAGSVHENYDLLAEFPVTIVAEYYCPVSLHLLARPGASISTISEVASHPKALEQCSTFLEGHLNLRQRVVSDTAGAAQLVQLDTGDGTTAAIASEECAQLYNLTVIARDIQNHRSNLTRFVALAREGATPSATVGLSKAALRWKSSLIVSITHRPGALSALLAAIAGIGWNLTKIESRPLIGSPFHYRFYLDIECTNAPVDDDSVRTTIAPFCSELRVLGCYAAMDW